VSEGSQTLFRPHTASLAGTELHFYAGEMVNIAVGIGLPALAQDTGDPKGIRIVTSDSMGYFNAKYGINFG